MPIPGDLYSEGSLQFDGGLTSDYFHVGKQMIINGAQSNDLEGLMGMSNVESGRRVGVIQSFENVAGEFSFLTLVNRGLNGSAYVLLDDTGKKGALLQISSNPDYLLKLATFAANSTTQISLLTFNHSGYLAIGPHVPLAPLHIATDSVTIPVYIDICNTTNCMPGLFGRRSRGTIASPSGVTTGDFLGGFAGRGYHSGGAWETSSPVLMVGACSETHTSTAWGTYLSFETTPNGSTGRAVRMRIDHNGNIGIGTTPDANALLDVSSTTKAVLFPRMTTTQRDAIASPVEGMLIYNTTTHVFNFRNNSVWAAI
jgi:hypothetical protein